MDIYDKPDRPLSQRTLLEMVEGRKHLKEYSLLNQINIGTDALKKRFPRLKISTQHVPAPYDNIHIKVTGNGQTIVLVDTIEGFPNELLITELALLG